jgi:NAD(P)-dependent dehydrogenase (short-subunit alcohol dehydrogenase family)
VKVVGKVVAVTGAAHGIGQALSTRFVNEGAATVVMLDVDEAGVQASAKEIGARAIGCDVGNRDDLHAAIDQIEREVGPIGLFCSNAAVFSGDIYSGGLDSTSPETWDRSWRVNTMSHIWTAEVLVPLMLERGGGWFLQVLSAAGLITGPSGVAYTVTKHAGIGFAEWLSIRYRREGVGVSCLCPTAVATSNFAAAHDADDPVRRNIGLLQTPEEVAQSVVDGLAAEHFLILPNPRVGSSFLHKAEDYDRWLDHTAGRIAAMNDDGASQRSSDDEEKA